jgi:hypothetical protein
LRCCLAIRHVTVYDTAGDSVPGAVEIRDTGKVADIADTTMSDGARIGVTLRARLIVPPVSAAIRYTPSPDTVKKLVYHDTVTVRRTSWTGITIGTLAGFSVGVAGMAILAYTLTRGN